MSNEYDEKKVRTYIEESLDLFIKDPPDTEFQLGFLAALKDVYINGLGLDLSTRKKELRNHLH